MRRLAKSSFDQPERFKPELNPSYCCGPSPRTRVGLIRGREFYAQQVFTAQSVRGTAGWPWAALLQLHEPHARPHPIGRQRRARRDRARRCPLPRIHRILASGYNRPIAARSDRQLRPTLASMARCGLQSGTCTQPRTHSIPTSRQRAGAIVSPVTSPPDTAARVSRPPVPAHRLRSANERSTAPSP